MERKWIKIVTIGGGSSYTPELIEGFIKRIKELPVKEIWLVDIEEGKEKLEIVGNLAKRMVKAAGIDCEVHLTLDRRKAIKDAIKCNCGFKKNIFLLLMYFKCEPVIYKIFVEKRWDNENSNLVYAKNN